MSSEKTLLALPAKRFQVALPSAFHREAFQRYSKDQRRSMDAQASIFLVEKLIELGYIEPKHARTGTQ